MQYHFSSTFRLNYKGDFTTKPTLVTGDGDGTVNKRSLESCRLWSNMKEQRGKNIIVTELPGADHMGILSDSRVVNYVVKLLTGEGIDQDIYELSDNQIEH